MNSLPFPVTDLFRVGDKVFVDCIEGFGGPATVVEIRQGHVSRCKVQLDDGKLQPAFWAYDMELSPQPSQEGTPGTPYDSRGDTLCHISEVRKRLTQVILDFEGRSLAHDLSKLEEPEKSTFDEFTPKLKTSTYGSEEYKGFLATMKVALEHHYRHNSHHPEHYPNGIQDMSLLDLIETLVDWDAATKRHANGDLRKSIEINQKRFGYTDELKKILINTAERLGFILVEKEGTSS